jgi:anti-anti-sigma factor
MEINKEIINGVTVVTISGRLDTTNYSDLDKYLTELIADGNLSILLDCKDLVYISSSGLRVFLKALKSLDEKGGKLAVCEFNERIKDIFKVSGFTELFDYYSAKADALKSFV